LGFLSAAMRFDDRILMAFAYGELSPEDTARIAEALEGDPELAARVERFRHTRAALRTVYDSVAAEPIPEHLRALLGDVATAEPPPPLLPPSPPIMPHMPARRRLALPALAWAAIAAALIMGVIAGRLATPEPLFVQGEGQLRAGLALSRALNDRLSTDPVVSGVRLGGSFYAGGDGACRTFTQESVSGIACREGENWTIRFTTSRGEGPDPAAALMAMVDTMIDGAPLTPAEEAEARERNWRR
jgi:hypothetical protein